MNITEMNDRVAACNQKPGLFGALDTRHALVLALEILSGKHVNAEGVERTKQTIVGMLRQHGLEGPDAGPDGYLTDLADTIIFG